MGNYHKALYDYAKGDYALVLDGDDYLIYRSYINKARRLIKENDLILVFAKQNVQIEKNNKIISDKMNNKLPQIIEGTWLFKNYPRGYSIPHLSTVYNRKYAMKIGYYNKNILSSDWESVLRLMLNKKVGFINKPVGVWRKHFNNESKSLDLDKIIKNIEYIEGPYEYVLKNNLFGKAEIDSWKTKMLKRYFLKNILKLLILKEKIKNKELLSKIKKIYGKNIYYNLIFDPRLILMTSILWNKFLTSLIFKHIIKNESFLGDLKEDQLK